MDDLIVGGKKMKVEPEEINSHNIKPFKNLTILLIRNSDISLN